MLAQQIPELVQGRLDLAVGPFEQRVDEAADVVANLRRGICDGKARLGALLEPLGSLAVRLVAAPRVEERRHGFPIGLSGRRASTLFA